MGQYVSRVDVAINGQKIDDMKNFKTWPCSRGTR